MGIVKTQAVKENIRDPLFEKIKWLMFFRVVVITLVLGATAVIQIQKGIFFSPVSPLPFYFLLGLTYALTLIYVLLLRRLRNLRKFAYAQVLGDVFFITLLIYFTGGIESIFSWLYLFSIFSAGTILYRRGALLVASASSILYGTLLDLDYFGVIVPIGARFPSSQGYQGIFVLYLIAVNMVAFYLVAILSSYLSEQVRRKEEELKKRIVDYNQLERLYKHIVQNVVSGLVTVDEEGHITSFNPMAEEITGYKLEEVYHDEIGVLFPGFEEWSRMVERPPEKGKEAFRFSRFETGFKRRDGATLTLGFSVSPLKDSRDNEIGRILIFQDLTKLREVEEHLKRADRLAAVGKMAAGMAHEIRNPLASISGSIEMLKDDGENSSHHQKLMGIILREVGRLNDLIEDFLLFARPTSAGKERIHLNAVVEEILRVFPHSPECRSQIHCSTDFQEDIYIQGDSSQIKQIFWNLFINAAQAMPEGGEIQVAIRRRSALLPFLGEPERVEIAVGDTGPGIAEAELGRIFDPFYTTKEKGTGLGLSVVHSIVENYGGKIIVRSEPGKGTVFSVFLPIQ